MKINKDKENVSCAHHHKGPNFTVCAKIYFFCCILFYRYCSHGSLLMYLRSKKDDFVAVWDPEEEHEIGFSALTKMALQASQGMAFLESKKVTFYNHLCKISKIHLSCISFILSNFVRFLPTGQDK